MIRWRSVIVHKSVPIRSRKRRSRQALPCNVSPPSPSIPGPSIQATSPMELAVSSLLLASTLASPRLVWLKNSSGVAEVSFSSTPGAHAPASALVPLINSTALFVERSDGQKSLLLLTLKSVSTPLGQADMLTAPIPFVAPFLLKSTTIGHTVPGMPSALRLYYAFNSAVTRPHDWMALDAAEKDDGVGGLSITLRDPFMIGGIPGEGVLSPPFPAAASPADECPPGVSWHEGDACLIAVVRFNGTVLTDAHNITTYVSDGGAGAVYRTLLTQGGVTVVRLPPAATGAVDYYASAHYREERVHGAYTVLDHWATTSTLLLRPWVAPSPSPFSPPKPPPPHVPPYPVQPPPPASPPSPPVPGWVDWLMHNSFGSAFGGAFLACSLCGALVFLGWALVALARHRKAVAEMMSRRRPGMNSTSFLSYGDSYGNDGPRGSGRFG